MSSRCYSKEFKYVFATIYKDLKSIPPQLVQHKIKVNTSIPPAHQTRYKLTLNYVVVVKHNIDKLLATRFIQPVEEVTWLSLVVVVPKNNGKLKIYVDFKKLNKAIKKYPYPLPFFDEVLNTIAGYEAYSFLAGYSKYHQISIALEYRYKKTFVINWGAFVWMVM
jgi:hypothetical protein